MVNLYKAMWSKIGGRPWTFIIRDTWHRYEWFWIVGLIYFGAWFAQAYGMNKLREFLIALTIGYIMGHLFWGTSYIPDQREDTLTGGEE